MQERRESVTLESGGRRIFGILHLPDGVNPPLVIVMHGFSSNKIGTNGSYLRLAQGLSEAGIATFRFDFRGCGDSEGDLGEMTLENFIDDGVLVFEEMKKRGFSRIGIFGSSFGGSIGVLTAIRVKKLKSLVLWAPVASGMLWLKDFLKKSGEVFSPETTLKTFRGVTLHPKLREDFGKMNAADLIGELKEVPMLHFQGENDETISLDHQKAFFVSRKGASALTEFIIYPETDHSLGRAAVLPKVVAKAVNWFQRTL